MWFSQHQLFSTLSGWGLSPKFFQIIQAALSITHWVLKLLFCHNNLLTVGALSCCLWQTPPNGTMQKKKKKTLLHKLSETGLCSAAPADKWLEAASHFDQFLTSHSFISSAMPRLAPLWRTFSSLISSWLPRNVTLFPPRSHTCYKIIKLLLWMHLCFFHHCGIILEDTCGYVLWGSCLRLSPRPIHKATLE